MARDGAREAKGDAVAFVASWHWPYLCKMGLSGEYS